MITILFYFFNYDHLFLFSFFFILQVDDFFIINVKEIANDESLFCDDEKLVYLPAMFIL